MAEEPHVSLTSAIERYLTHLQVERNCTRNTIASYRKDFGLCLRFLAGVEPRRPVPLTALTTDRLLAWFAAQMATTSVVTRDRRLTSAKGLGRFAVRRGWLAANPADGIERAKRPARLPVVFSREEAAAILDAPWSEDPLVLRDKAILETLYATGLRAHELHGLRRRDLDPAAGTVTVVGKGDVERTSQIGQRALAAIAAYAPVRARWRQPAKDPRDSVFISRKGGPLSVSGLEQMLRRRGQQLHLTKRPHPHAWRHSCGTALLEGGADLRVIAKQLGHRDIGSTMRYTHVVDRLLAETYRKAHPRAA